MRERERKTNVDKIVMRTTNKENKQSGTYINTYIHTYIYKQTNNTIQQQQQQQQQQQSNITIKK